MSVEKGISVYMHQLLKEKLAEHFGINPGHISLFWKGRVALYAILKAMGIGEGDEIILPAFTCVVAVNPIIYSGAKPVYVDIDSLTYNIDTSLIEQSITDRTKAILAQNTFGLAPDLDGIRRLADKHNLVVIEDCAHGFGGSYKGRPNGTIAAASFFSSQWNKPFSTGLGGFAVAKDPVLAAKLEEYEKAFLTPTLKDESVLKALLFIRESLNTNFYWTATKAYRWLSKHNLILGSSQGEELEEPVKPKGFEKGFSKTQAKRAIEELIRFDKIAEHRKATANAYKATLLELGIGPPYEPGYAEHTYLKFPLLVKDRVQFFRAAQKERIELGDWFLSPIHPIVKNFDLWHYTWGENPVAERISQHIINLPNHPGINEPYRDKVSAFLKNNRRLVYRSYQDAFTHFR
jgi:dTDP-4-amino-4,6-dideoxygalactose transaminase